MSKLRMWGRPPACRASVARKLRQFGQLAMTLLRELADENAYRRHLETHGREASGKEWRRFSEERLRAKYARAKCC